MIPRLPQGLTDRWLTLLGSRAPRHRLPDSLAWAVILFLAMLAGGAAIYMVALDRLLAAQQNHDEQTALLREAQADLRKLPDRMMLISQAQTDFETMRRQGFLRPGDRLDWISTLSRIGRELRAAPGAAQGLQSLTWQLEPSQAHASQPNLWVTPMTLRAAPISTAELAHLLRRLADEAHGSMTVENCSLAIGRGSGQMECRLLWWNWRDRTASRPSAPDAAGIAAARTEDGHGH